MCNIMSKSFERHVTNNMSSNNTNTRIYSARYLINGCLNFICHKDSFIRNI